METCLVQIPKKKKMITTIKVDFVQFIGKQGFCNKSSQDCGKTMRFDYRFCLHNILPMQYLFCCLSDSAIYCLQKS